jgi:hypothetical protein
MSLWFRLKKLFRWDQERNYVSPIDIFLHEFDTTHPKRSLSQEKEVLKHRRIASLRDYPEKQNPSEKNDIFDNF